MSDPTGAPKPWYHACTACKELFPRGQSEPHCLACQAPVQGPLPAAPPGASEPPDWARSLSQAVESLTHVVGRLVDRPPLPQAATIPVAPAGTTVSAAPTGSLPPSESSRARHTQKRSRVERTSSPDASLSPPCVRAQSSLSSQRDTLSEGELADSDVDMDSELPSKLASAVGHLVTSIRDTFQLHDDPPSSEQAGVSFLRPKQASKVFPIHADFSSVVSKAWTRPNVRFITPKKLDICYPFPADSVTTWTSPPKVDPPVARLSKSTTIPVQDGSSLQSVEDRRTESLSKAIFTASGSALRPVFASAWVGKAVSEWGLQLERELGSDVPVQDLRSLAQLIVQAGKFVCEASLDAGALIARSSALAVSVRRELWLKVWAADAASKRSLAGLPFTGSRLFGTRLDELISEATGGKSTHLPQSRPMGAPRGRAGSSRFRSFRKPTGSRPAASSSSSGPAQDRRKKPFFRTQPTWRKSQPARAPTGQQPSA